MDENHMLLERDGHIATITINRPEQRNAMLSGMWKWLAETMRELNDDNDVRCVVLRGAGEKAFASGADISEFEVWTSPEKSVEYGGLIEGALQSIERHANPVIAMIQGYALGAGCQLSVACDLRILADGAKVGIPSAKLGVMLNYENYQRFVNLVGISIAREIFCQPRRDLDRKGDILHRSPARRAARKGSGLCELRRPQGGARGIHIRRRQGDL
jgi:enoyl-CoA hydratase/carnithine racemase